MIRLHDTMAREKREFVPADPKRITMYVCGPTVYGRAHIGNARPAVVFDLLRRVLEHAYPDADVIYARNVTDVDDKIMAAAAEEGVEVGVITDRYERFYLEDMGALGVNPPTIAPHATQEILPMIDMIAELIASGHAYEAEGHVLFSVPSDPDYGALSRRDREQMIAGARVEVAPYKRDPADFVLWKPSAETQVGWPSPWGRGRPGWHIECSAMIRQHLGRTIDIHGGGLDLIFPHHENEIAQSRCAHAGEPLARYWVHNGFVDMGAEKMSKSLGNVVTPEALLKEHKGEVLRMALLSAHYRQPLPWTEALIDRSRATLNGLYRKVGETEPTQIDPDVIEALRDDLNLPAALAALYRIDDPGILKASANLLGLLTDTEAGWFGRAVQMDARGSLKLSKIVSALLEMDGLENTVENLIALRTTAKREKKFAQADAIRDELKANGILLEDNPDGTSSWRRV